MAFHLTLDRTQSPFNSVSPSGSKTQRESQIAPVMLDDGGNRRADRLAQLERPLHVPRLACDIRRTCCHLEARRIFSAPLILKKEKKRNARRGPFSSSSRGRHKSIHISTARRRVQNCRAWLSSFARDHARALFLFENTRSF